MSETVLTKEQELRDKYMEVLLCRPTSIKVQDAMLMAVPIVDFILTGTILGVDLVGADDPAVSVKDQRTAARR